MTGALFIAYDALRMNISSQPPQKHFDPKHKIWHPLKYCSTYFQANSHPITSFFFLSIFIAWVFFSLESHLTGEPCDHFILSLKVARITFWHACFGVNKSVFGINSILIKQVWFFKTWWSEKAQGTQAIKILNWGTGEHRDSFHWSKRTGTHWEGLNIFSYAKILTVRTNYGHDLHLILIW